MTLQGRTFATEIYLSPVLRHPAPPELGETPPLDRLRPLLAASPAALDVDGPFLEEEVAAFGGRRAAPDALARRRWRPGLGHHAGRAGVAPFSVALRLVGRASLPLGRIFEGHVTGARLALRRGDAAQARAAARDLRAVRLFGVRDTDPLSSGMQNPSGSDV